MVRREHPSESDDVADRRDRRPTRRRRPDEDLDWNEAEDEASDVPRRKKPRDQRRRVEIEKGELDLGTVPRAPWVPPARR